MNTLYQPRWRNAIKGVRYSYDDRLGGGNILAWGMGGGVSYERKVLKPRFWHNIADTVADNQDFGLYYDPLAADQQAQTMHEDYQEAAQYTYDLAEQNRLAIVAAAAEAARQEASRQRIADAATAAAELARLLAIANNARMAADEAADIAAATALNGTKAAAEQAERTAADLKEKADAAVATLNTTTKPLTTAVTQPGTTPIIVAGGIAVAGILSLIL